MLYPRTGERGPAPRPDTEVLWQAATFARLRDRTDAADEAIRPYVQWLCGGAPKNVPRATAALADLLARISAQGWEPPADVPPDRGLLLAPDGRLAECSVADSNARRAARAKGNRRARRLWDTILPLYEDAATANRSDEAAWCRTDALARRDPKVRALLDDEPAQTRPDPKVRRPDPKVRARLEELGIPVRDVLKQSALPSDEQTILAAVAFGRYCSSKRRAPKRPPSGPRVSPEVRTFRVADLPPDDPRRRRS